MQCRFYVLCYLKARCTIFGIHTVFSASFCVCCAVLFHCFTLSLALFLCFLVIVVGFNSIGFAFCCASAKPNRCHRNKVFAVVFLRVHFTNIDSGSYASKFPINICIDFRIDRDRERKRERASSNQRPELFHFRSLASVPLDLALGFPSHIDFQHYNLDFCVVSSIIWCVLHHITRYALACSDVWDCWFARWVCNMRLWNPSYSFNLIKHHNVWMGSNPSELSKYYIVASIDLYNDVSVSGS